MKKDTIKIRISIIVVLYHAFFYKTSLMHGMYISTVDIEDDKDLDNLYNFLKNNYIGSETLKLIYDKETLRNILTPPGYSSDLYICIKDHDSVIKGFISAIPMKIVVNNEQKEACFVNLLCLHQKIRNKKLANNLIDILTERCIKKYDIAFYTRGQASEQKHLCSKNFFHRAINLDKLVECNFFPPINNHFIPYLSLKWQELTKQDIPLLKFDDKETIHQVFTDKEKEHYFLKLCKSYIVKTQDKITHFIAFYSIDIICNETIVKQGIIYKFYGNNVLGDSICLGKRLGYDVINYLSLSNDPVFSQLNFLKGTGTLYYYSHYSRKSEFNINDTNDIGITPL